MPRIGAAFNAVRELSVFNAMAQKAIPPVSKAFHVARDIGVADKLRGISQIGMA